MMTMFDSVYQVLMVHLFLYNPIQYVYLKIHGKLAVSNVDF